MNNNLNLCFLNNANEISYNDVLKFKTNVFDDGIKRDGLIKSWNSFERQYLTKYSIDDIFNTKIPVLLKNQKNEVTKVEANKIEQICSLIRDCHLISGLKIADEVNRNLGLIDLTELQWKKIITLILLTFISDDEGESTDVMNDILDEIPNSEQLIAHSRSDRSTIFGIKVGRHLFRNDNLKSFSNLIDMKLVSEDDKFVIEQVANEFGIHIKMNSFSGFPEINYDFAMQVINGIDTNIGDACQGIDIIIDKFEDVIVKDGKKYIEKFLYEINQN